SELIVKMDKFGIGTDATMAEHIHKIQERNYCFLNNQRRFEPKPLGIGLCNGYDNMGLNLAKPYLRANMEKDIYLICQDLKTKEEFIVSCIGEMKQIYIEVTQKAICLDIAIQSCKLIILQNDNQSSQVINNKFVTCGYCNQNMQLMEIK